MRAGREAGAVGITAPDRLTPPACDPATSVTGTNSVMPEQGEQNDNGQRNAQQPKQYTSSEAHQSLLTVFNR